MCVLVRQSIPRRTPARLTQASRCIRLQKLLDGSKGADSSLLLSLQASHLASLRLTLETPVAEEHYPVFDALWIASGLEDTDESNRWRRFGFLSESPQYEFARPGLLGLKALRRFADDSQNEFSQVRVATLVSSWDSPAC